MKAVSELSCIPKNFFTPSGSIKTSKLLSMKQEELDEWLGALDPNFVPINASRNQQHLIVPPVVTSIVKTLLAQKDKEIEAMRQE